MTARNAHPGWEQIDISELWRLAKGMPEEWYKCDSDGLSRLIHKLFDRLSFFSGER
jgi:hypothetical protein